MASKKEQETGTNVSEGTVKKRSRKKAEKLDEVLPGDAVQGAEVAGEKDVSGMEAADEVSLKKKRVRKKAAAPSDSSSEAVTEETAKAVAAADEAEKKEAVPEEAQKDERKAMLTPELVQTPVTLGRKRGRLVQQRPAERQIVSSESARESAGPVFEAKALDVVPEFLSFPVMLPGFYPLKFPGFFPPRKAGKFLSKDEFFDKRVRCSGRVRNDAGDRPNVLKDRDDVAGEELLPKLGHESIEACVGMLRGAEIRASFDELLLHEAEWCLVSNMYNYFRKSMAPGKKDELEQEPVQVRDPVEELMMDADAGPDPVVEAIFEIFEKPLVPLFLQNEDESELREFYISQHADRITNLLCDWARSLEYIEKNVTGGPDHQYLSVKFIERFRKIMALDEVSSQSQGVVLPDLFYRDKLHLDETDLLLLWIMASHEIDPNFRMAMRSTWNQQTVVYMSACALMRFFCMNQAERNDLLKRLSASSRMASCGLFKVLPGTVPTQPISFEIILSEQIIYQFTGVKSLSVASTQYGELQFPHFSDDTYVAPSHFQTFAIIRNYFERPKLNGQLNLEHENLDFIPSLAFHVEGLPGSGRATLVKIIASRLGRPVIMVQCSPLAGIHPTDCEEYLKNVFIDAFLMDAIVCFRDAGPLLTEERTASIFSRQLAIRPVVCAFCTELAVKIHPVVEPTITFKAKMDGNLRDSAVDFWNQHLHLPQIETSHVDVGALSQRMALQPFQIQKATKLAYYSTNNTQGGISLNNASLEKAAAVQVTKNIGNLAFVSDPEIDLTDVIVSDDIMEKIKKIIGSAINRRRVLYEWGLSKRIRRGTGVIALFDGEPGTGKTHSAEAIAHELGLSLMRINIATMVDKYIGETEKNLTTIFEQARPDMQLLLFDEADSLFTKRTSNVSKSNDRYSNMSVNVLLQLVERYEGVSILTTNLKNAIDPAFERRITYKIYFPMPKQPERERLWRYMCPPEILTAEPIDYEWLSELEMSGGEIKNAVLTAAFTAATQGVLLDSEILYNAGVMEASAAGRVMKRYETGDDFSEY